ncbi:hypothetical protein [Nonomuraea harbinensis]|uniref:DUF1648 domain-containing protein n=1 Tax=Nonomuraea harbinensis TaxID=1286938 RepID=A0ABW1BUM8_9ACTN|nr:hypothetical protein [Nonomuraea harbinensis]
MNLRTIAVPAGAVVAVAVVGPPLALRDRLPDPMAVHWGPGMAPDNAVSFPVHLIMQAALWGFLWLGLVAAARRARDSRSGRVSWWALFAGGALFAISISAMTLLANLDVPTWTDARLSPLAAVAVLVVPLAAAALSGYLGRGEPDPLSGDGEPPRLTLRSGQRAVWVSRISNPWPLLITAAGAAVLFALGTLDVTGVVRLSSFGAVLPALVIVLAVGLFASSLTARVSEDGLVLAFGPFGWPVRRIRLDKIDRAYTEDRHPSQVGGWGVRGLPGRATIMLRGGECLVLRYRSGGQLGISIDDAERGASLINTLIAERRTA